MMKLEIKMTKGSELLLNESVTAASIPENVITILESIHECKLEIERRD